MPTLEGLQLIQHFIDANKDSGDTSGGFVKTIGNRLLGRARSEKLSLMPDNGYKNLGDVFDFEGNPGMSVNNVNEYRTLSVNRYRQYGAYDQMADDTVISSALDMYADDATQTDAKGDRVWVSSDDEECQSLVENVLSSLGIKKDVWKIAHTLAHYGDVYLELFYDKISPNAVVKLNEGTEVTESTKSISLNEELTRVTEDYTTHLEDVDEKVHNKSDGYIINRVQFVADIENMFDLQVNGKTVAFARVPEDSSTTQTRLGYIETSANAGNTQIRYYPADKFVHFYLDQSDRRNKEYFVAQLDNGNQFRFEIVRGKSMIHDVFRVQRSLELLEHTILLNRVSKSSLFRFVKVEVGQMSKTNVSVTLRNIKNLIESKLTINTTDGTYKPYADPGPIENFLYIPVKDGQGNISVDTVGGDVNIRDIADIDYYNNKLFAGLKIPKSFLNFEDTLSSFGGGGALTKQDERYARTIKRLQSFVIDGLNRLLDIFLDNRGLRKFIGKYEVKMVQPYTSEDAGRDEMFSSKLEAVKQFIDAVTAVTGATEGGIKIDNEKLVDYLAEDIMDDASLKDILVIAAKTSTGGEGTGSLDGGTPDFSEGSDMGDLSMEEPLGGEAGEEQEMSGEESEPAFDENIDGKDFGVEWEDILPK